MLLRQSLSLHHKIIISADKNFQMRKGEEKREGKALKKKRLKGVKKG